MKAAQSPESRQILAPLLGKTVEALKVEIKEAGNKLGFDVGQEGWIEQAIEEARSYPLVIAGDVDAGAILRLMPMRIRARVQALQQLEYLANSLLPSIEFEDLPRECDEAITGLREAMALDPAPVPLTECAKQCIRQAEPLRHGLPC